MMARPRLFRFFPILAFPGGAFLCTTASKGSARPGLDGLADALLEDFPGAEME